MSRDRSGQRLPVPVVARESCRTRRPLVRHDLVSASITLDLTNDEYRLRRGQDFPLPVLPVGLKYLVPPLLKVVHKFLPTGVIHF